MRSGAMRSGGLLRAVEQGGAERRGVSHDAVYCGATPWRGALIVQGSLEANVAVYSERPSFCEWTEEAGTPPTRAGRRQA